MAENYLEIENVLKFESLEAGKGKKATFGWLEQPQRPPKFKFLSSGKGAFIYEVRCFGGIFDLPTYPNQILYYISLFSKNRCSLTYLPT